MKIDQQVLVNIIKYIGSFIYSDKRVKERNVIEENIPHEKINRHSQSVRMGINM